MKKIIIIFFLVFFIFQTFAFMPATVYDYKIWKIDKIEKDENILKISFDSFVYYKIWDYLDFYKFFKNRNIFIDEMIEIKDFPVGLILQKWDIVAIDSYWWVQSTWILKIFCEKWIIKSIWTKSEFFWTSSHNWEKLENIEYNDDYLSKTLNQKIGCEKLYNFFDKDRRFQDLFWLDFKKIFFIFIICFLMILTIFLFINYKKHN